jgi:hypothetical protein
MAARYCPEEVHVPGGPDKGPCGLVVRHSAAGSCRCGARGRWCIGVSDGACDWGMPDRIAVSIGEAGWPEWQVRVQHTSPSCVRGSGPGCHASGGCLGPGTLFQPVPQLGPGLRYIMMIYFRVQLRREAEAARPAERIRPRGRPGECRHLHRVWRPGIGSDPSAMPV